MRFAAIRSHHASLVVLVAVWTAANPASAEELFGFGAIAINIPDLNFGGETDPLAPLNDGTLVDNPQARADYVHNNLGTWIGDSNLDGEFNSGDVVSAFAAGKYETDEDASWAEGDWDGDKRFGSGDLVAAFADGGYEAGRRPEAEPIPEPVSLVPLLLAASGTAVFRRSSKNCRRK